MNDITILTNVIRFLDIDDINTLYTVSHLCKYVIDYNKVSLAKRLLKMYDFDYTDSDNFVYVYKNTLQSRYKRGLKYDYSRLFNLYYKMYRLQDISYINRNKRRITQIPKLPYLERLTIFGHNIRVIKGFPQLSSLYAPDGELEEISECPKIKNLICYNNRLKGLKNFPEMEMLNCSDNDLHELSGISNAIEIYCSNNPNLLHIKDISRVSLLDVSHNVNLECIEDASSLENFICINTPRLRVITK